MKTRAGFIISLMVCFMFTGCSLPSITLFPRSTQGLEEYSLEGSGDDKILVMSIDGTISNRGRRTLMGNRPGMIQQVAAYLRRAETDPDIKALLIKVNTPGGTVTASDIIYNEIKGYKQRTGVKVVVVMMGMATSGGYYISLPADKIMAHPTTVTGSIGVIFMHPNVSALMEKVGVAMNVNTSGPDKDMGSPYRPTTDEEQALFQELTDQLAQRFIGLVVDHRHLTADQRDTIASARVFLADEAKRLGLVDEIGYLPDAVALTKQTAGLADDTRVIAYRRFKSKDDTIYNPAIETTEGELEAAVPILAQLSAVGETGFYYIWPAGIDQ